MTAGPVSLSPIWPLPACPEPGAPIDWLAVAAQFPCLSALADCPQDPAFHAEGDVLTHTRMVAEALVSLDPWRRLDPSARAILFAAALLHDVGKGACTTLGQGGRITSPGHSRKGAGMARAMLYRCDGVAGSPPALAVREMAVSLVRWHGLPLNFLDKPSPQRAVIRASMTARCDWLALLAEADVRGRRCGQTSELLDRITMFSDYARENGCADAPRPFASDHARAVYLANETGSPDYDAFDDTRCEVVLMAGLPGAGKDHWRARHPADRPVISLDTVRATLDIDPADDQGPVIATAKEKAREFLRRRESFAWNATNVTRPMRGQLIRFFRAYGARVRIVYVEAPYVELLQRNDGRKAKVPRSVIDRLIDKLEVPDLTEAERVEWVEGSQ